LLARGHLLIEDVPGVGKTTLAQALARSVDSNFHRLQFTSDMLPSDVLGVTIYNAHTEGFEFKPGPVFTHFLLADEINRASPKTQSALLEAMQESRVTVLGETHLLPLPFFVLATQNPIELEGTYPLPEAQLDRFLFKIEIDYPSIAEEVAIVVRATLDQTGDELPLGSVTPLLNGKAVMQLQQTAARQRVDEQVLDYAVRLVRATRDWAGLAAGSGSRGALALVRGARAAALLDRRNYVTPDDVKRIALPALRHRIALSPDALLEGRHANDVLADIIEAVAAPRM